MILHALRAFSTLVKRRANSTLCPLCALTDSTSQAERRSGALLSQEVTWQALPCQASWQSDVAMQQQQALAVSGYTTMAALMRGSTDQYLVICKAWPQYVAPCFAKEQSSAVRVAQQATQAGTPAPGHHP